jgi:hypothetical protein
MATLYTEDDLNDIIMACPAENTNYPNPDIMIQNNKKLYAYVTLVMLGDKYVSAAIVLAHSIRQLGSQADLVVLVTPDVSEDGKLTLHKFYDHVININYITIPNWRTKQQKHKKYLELVFTKFHVFDLVQYKKILLIDADALVLKYPDHLFSLNTPAGCFLEDKNLIISYDEEGNYILPKEKTLKWYQKYCDCCGHGKLIPQKYTDRVLTDRNNSGIGGGLMLLEPKEGEFKNILKELGKKSVQNRLLTRMHYLTGRTDIKAMVEHKFAWPEQQYLTARYSGKWTSINPRFFGLQGYPHWKVLYGLQYGGDKPFILNSKFDVKVRIQYPDYILWHQIYKNILLKYPELTSSSALKEVNEFHKYFYSSLKRHEKFSKKIKHSEHIEPTRHMVTNLYHLKDSEIYDDQLKYYHVSTSGIHRPVNMAPMWNDIDEYNYIEPIKRLSKYFGKTTNYYSKMLKMYEDLDMTVKQRLDMYDRVSPNDIDLILSEYVKCRPSVFIITLWPIVTKYVSVDDITNLLNQHGNVYCVKTINLSKNGLYNLMFAMYDEFTYGARNDFLNKKMDYIEASDTNDVTIFVFDDVKNMKLSGQGSIGKTLLRTSVLDMMKKVKRFDNLRGNDIMHINDHFYQTVEYAQLMFNKNSIDFLESQNITNLCSPFMTTSHLKLQTFKNWVFNNMSLLEMTRLITMGGMILYLYGIRIANDIDGIYVSNGIQSDDLNKIMHKNFENDETKFSFADIGVEGSSTWRDSWTQKNLELLAQFDIESTSELVTNPQYHFYYQGLKFYLLDHEIMRKMMRNRKQDHSDFFMMATLHASLISKYVQISNKLDLVYVDSKIKPPEISLGYMKAIINMIRDRYTHNDFNKFHFRYRTDK